MKFARRSFNPRARHFLATGIRALLPSLGLIAAASGADYYWDTNGATGASGNAGGTWDTTTANWTTDAAGATATTTWLDGSNAIFSAGTDGTGAKTITLSGTFLTPLVKLEEVGLVTLSGGTIDITGGSTFDTSVLGATTGRSLTWNTAITGNGDLTLKVNGDTSAGGGGSDSIFALTGANTFTGNVSITSGVVGYTSSLGALTNKVILNGGGLVGNTTGTFAYDVQVGANPGIVRTYGAATLTLSGSVSNASGVANATLNHTDSGVVSYTGSAASFFGTYNNQAGTTNLAAASANWSGTDFNIAAGSLTISGGGTSTMKSLTTLGGVALSNSSKVNISTGTLTFGAAAGAIAVTGGTAGGITSSSGTLTVTNGATTGSIGASAQGLQVVVSDFDISTPLKLVKNNVNSLTMDQANTYTGGTTINGGRINAANAGAFGTGNVTVNSGGQAWLSVAGPFANNFVLNGIGASEAAGNLGAIRFGGATINGSITLASNARLNAHGSNGTIAGGIVETGGARTLEIGGSGSASTINLITNPASYTGATLINQGTLNVGTVATPVSANLLTGTPAITLGGGSGNGSLVYNIGGSFALSTPITFGTTGSVFKVFSAASANTVTFNTTIGGPDATYGTVTVDGGQLTLGSSAVVTANTVIVTSNPANSATAALGQLNIGPGASVTTRFVDVGDSSAANYAGIINQTGGTVTAIPGGNGVRIGHWANGATPGSQYNLTGGTFDATALFGNTGTARYVAVGWDGAATMTVSGAGTMKTFGLYVDAAGVDQPGIVNLQAGGTIEVGAGGTLNDGTTGSILNLSGGTLRGTATSTWASKMDVNTASTIDVTTGSGVTVSGAFTGVGTISKTGNGVLAINAGNLTGGITVNGGILAGAGGTTLGAVTVGAAGILQPGTGTTAGSPGMMTVGALTVNGRMNFDLAPGNFSFAGSNDAIFATDQVNINGGVFSPTFSSGTITPGTYTLIYSSGGVNLNSVPTLDAPSRLQFNFTTDALDLYVDVSGSTKALTWTGAGNAWDIGATTNWTDGVGGEKFYQFDAVTFDDSGSAQPALTLSGAIKPGSITVNSSSDYSLTGSGTIEGAPVLTKSGTGALTIGVNSTLGAITINAGTLKVGTGGTTGSIDGTGTIGVAAGATLVFNRSDAYTTARAFTATSAGTLTKEGTGTLTLTGFNLIPTNLIINGGTVAVTTGGFSGNRMVGNGVVTINSGGTLLIAAGAAHGFGGDNGTMTESFVVNNGGTLTVNQEQYFRVLTLNGGTINGSNEIRASGTTDWRASGTAPSTIASGVNPVNNLNFTVDDATASAAADLTISGVINNGGAGVLNKAGAGTLLLSGANVFNGNVNVNAGTVQLGNATGLGVQNTLGNVAVGVTSVASGATLDLNAQSVMEAVTLNGGSLVNSNTITGATFASGIAGIRVSTVGAGYTSNPTVAISGGGGTGATATAAQASGALSTIAVTAKGSGFTSVPTVTISGGGGTTQGTATAVISSVALAGTGTTNSLGGAGSLTITAPITGNGFTKVGNGALVLSGASNGSTFTGDIVINAGVVNPTAQGNGTTSALGQQVSTRTITINNGGKLSFGTNNVFGGGGTAATALPGIVVNAGGTLEANNYDVVGALTLNGGTVFQNRTGTPGAYQGFEFKGTVTVGGSAVSTLSTTSNYGNHLAGVISFAVADATAGTDLLVQAPLLNASPDIGGTGGVTKSGAGTMEIAAGNTSPYTGATTVSDGTLLVNGSISGTTTTVNGAGALLTGAGTTGAVTLTTGTLTAGNNGVGTLSTGALNLNGGTALFELAGTSSDKFSVTGAVAFGAPVALNLSFASDLADGTAFTLIANDGGDAFTFAGGAGFTVLGSPVSEGVPFNYTSGAFTETFQLSYIGNDGNDAVLTVVPEPGTALTLLSGLGMLLACRRRRS